MRAWFSGRTRPCQGRDSGSIPGARTLSFSQTFVQYVDNSVDTVYKRQKIWLITVL